MNLVEQTLEAAHNLMTVPEIKRATGLDEMVIRADLKALAQRGQIEHIPGRGRYDGRYGLLRPIAKATVKESLTVQEPTGADSEGGEADLHPVAHPVDFSAMSDLLKKPLPECSEADAQRDMLSDARTQLDMLREALGVPVEPHQSLFDRMLEEANLASAHRSACILWESSMMTAIGEDGACSVVDAIEKIKAELSNAKALTDKLEHLLGVERQTSAALREQIDLAERGRDAALINLSDHHAGFVVVAPKRQITRHANFDPAQARALSAARNGSGRGEVFALVKMGKAVRGAVWSPAK